ncbi:Wzz/FepE/Etk N-terminal domain-containing protein [Pseudoalteromonas sp. 2CM41L]|uniref:Wzz/FepE/Etk N-terminal domain-containing protein n=1 Tax=unclassified Pseudoalteromonas TaxID=194690 RepID=UPI0020BE6301|nr:MULTISPECIES: Wzz/FepE/Etk N-terminal domain-containing protein [unclassified Pseudoalteromonas]MCK8107705.1 Wzz/FepE/Etk N-terminal domain-containing protein [Pseudoalteromonas sp. 2CM41L]MCK8132659.1 Wzz/FepE/Etk N-terminal domain-containing protein [Pseudoalteromonas sp. 2CM28B]
MDRNVEAIEQDIDTTLSHLLKYKWLIIIGTVLSAILSVVVAINQPNTYTTQVFLSPVSKSDSGGLANLAGQFGGLASLAGVSLGGSQGSDVDAALEFMGSRGFLQTFINKRNLMPDLLALESWDKDTKTPIFDLDTYDPKNKVWTRKAPPGKSVIPTAWEGYEKLLSQINATDLTKKGLIELKITTVSPELSVKLTNWLIEDINEFWRVKDTTEAEEVIEYLKEQAAKTNVSELRSIFYELIADQTRTKLLSSVGDYHLLKPLSEVIYPEEKSGPSRALICIGITFLGGLFSLIIAFIFTLRSREK